MKRSGSLTVKIMPPDCEHCKYFTLAIIIFSFNPFVASHEKGGEKPEWASRVIGDATRSKDSTDILATDKNLIYQEKSLLLPDVLDIIRCKDANVVERSNCVVQCIDFHPHSNILLTAGFDKTLRLFNIDGINNEKIQSVCFEDLPISMAKFTADGKEIIVSGKRQYFYVFDLEKASIEKVHGLHGRREKSYENFAVSPCNKFIAFVGQAGSILVVCRKSKQLLHVLKMNSFVRSLEFSHDGAFLFSNGGDDRIYKWNMKNFTCDSVFHDDGCIKGTALAISQASKKSSSYLAAGSESGVVNIYKLAESSEFKGVPEKALMNLTTFVDGIVFNPDNQVMAMYSRTLKNSLRLVHLPTMRVFSNWPTAQTPLRHVQTLAFNAFGDFMAVGNDKGAVLLFQLPHYVKQQ